MNTTLPTSAALAGLLAFAPAVYADNCDTPNTYDSHVLAISWQPAFCEGKPTKPECKTLDTGRYDADHFTLHGLWPNKNSCGINYSACGAVKQSFQSFCDYPAMNLDDIVRENLSVAMPGARYGSCLQRHEWWKHGVCRDADPNAYFNLSMALLRQINLSDFRLNFIKPNIGKTVQRSDFETEFDNSFGDGASERLKLSCNRANKLTEIQMALPKVLYKDGQPQPLSDLFAQTPANAPGNRGSCGSSFELDLAGE
ncbi:MAG: ribonuclease T2 [Marinobacterium sp.]|nr:ribonuclease T2 [Marinobacterium sp.]